MDTLAVELVQLIALHVATPSTTTSSPRPPKDLISLLATSRSFYNALNPKTHPHLYAEIFRRTFDSSALYRRFPAYQITAPALTHELKRRWTCLARIRRYSTADGWSWRPRNYPKALLLEDLMTLYLMFIESDGQNAIFALQYANVINYLSKYKSHILDNTRLAPHMPEETEDVALWLWLCWFTLDYYKCIKDEGRNFEYLITPFVLGVFQYANTFAPWACPILPRSTTSPPSSSSSASIPRGPLVLANLSPSPNDLIPLGPRPSSTAIPGGYLSIPAGNDAYPLDHYHHLSSHGTNGVTFAFPLLHHAAVQLSLAREDSKPLFQHDAEPLTVGQLLNMAHQQGLFPSATTLLETTANLPPFVDYRTGNVPRNAYTPDWMRLKFACIVDSRRWDNEWARLAGCRDPTITPPVDVSMYRWTSGRMTGFWDGRLVIPNLEAYNRLLAALQHPAHDHEMGWDSDSDSDSDDEPDHEYPVNILEENMRLHNLQSFNLIEYHHRPLAHLPHALKPGVAINAHLPFDMVVERTVETWDPTMGRWRNGILVRSGGITSFYEAIPSSEASTTPVPTPPSGLPIIVLGQVTNGPRPMPTHFFDVGMRVAGIVRPWDGLVTLEVRGGDTRGRFVFNGYLVGEGEAAQSESGNWVGRWRDAHSEAMRVAWEGVFAMRKRGE